MQTKQFIVVIFLLLLWQSSKGEQFDSTIESLQKIPLKYLSTIDNKIDKYSSRITGKTEKSLAKLSRWENKIKDILDKVSPETSQKLFGGNQTTFSTVLQKIKKGEAAIDGYKAKYDVYRDKLTTSVKYLENQKDNLNKNILNPLKTAKNKLSDLEDDVSSAEAVEQFIKERKKKLLNEAVKYIGKSKYLTKIDKESYYYVETLRNYKQLFSDKNKAEELGIKILNKIPAFKKFARENSMLASLFRMPTDNGTVPNLQGLQTRESVNALIQSRIGTGGPNVQQQMSQSLHQAQAELSKLKDKILKGGGESSDANIPDFKPNMQKTKIFLQRLEYGSILDFDKANGYIPARANIGFSVGYKLNDKSVIGVGASYKMGLGSLQHIKVTHEGIGIRSFIDWKLKKQFYITGGFEMNYNAQFKNLTQLKYYNDWQKSGLVGVTKKVKIKTKWAKGTSIQLLYDMLYRQHYPVSQPVIFRIGYSFSK